MERPVLCQDCDSKGVLMEPRQFVKDGRSYNRLVPVPCRSCKGTGKFSPVQRSKR